MTRSCVTLAHLWHWYQPPWQSDFWVERIAEECYRPVSRWLRDNPAFSAAVNINHSLVERLVELGQTEVLDNLGEAAEQGTIEFTGSAAYHALLPVLLEYEYGEDEVRRQIELNEEGNRRVFGKVWNAYGFFPPEMAFSQELSAVLLDMGYSWAACDAVCYDGANSDSVPHSSVGTVEGLPVLFRSGWSNELSLTRPARENYDLASYAHDLEQSASAWFSGKQGQMLLSYDVETLGHHIPQYDVGALDQYLSACEQRGISLLLPSEIVESFPHRDVGIVSGSWSTTPEDVAAGEQYPLWDHSGNAVHALLKEMTQLAIRAVHEGEDVGSARHLLDYGLQSCKEWWANPPGLWSPENILSGFEYLEEAAVGATPGLREEVEGFRSRLEQLIFS